MIFVCQPEARVGAPEQFGSLAYSGHTRFSTMESKERYRKYRSIRRPFEDDLCSGGYLRLGLDAAFLPTAASPPSPATKRRHLMCSA
jgi:hypothetical protein